MKFEVALMMWRISRSSAFVYPLTETDIRLLVRRFFKGSTMGIVRRMQEMKREIWQGFLINAACGAIQLEIRRRSSIYEHADSVSAGPQAESGTGDDG